MQLLIVPTTLPPMTESATASVLLFGREITSTTKRQRSTETLSEENETQWQPKQKKKKINLQNHVANNHPLESESSYQKHICCLLNQPYKVSKKRILKREKNTLTILVGIFRGRWSSHVSSAHLSLILQTLI
jgi:hypothetical protein